MKKNLTKTNTKKRAMIKALESTLGIVSTACKKVGVSRITHYEWYKTDDEYKAGVDSVADIALDFAASQLHKQISGGSPTSTIFYLKTKGKKRGFVEKTEIEHTGDLNTTVTLFTLPDNERDE